MAERFVSVISRNLKVKNTAQQIEKIQMLIMWCNKSISFLRSFGSALNELESCSDKVQRGVLMERCESMYMAAITTFLRCFHDQPSFRLKIKDVTANQDLRAEFDEMKSLRDDEFVHWKGINSSMTVTYSFEFIPPASFKFGDNLNLSFQAKMKFFDTQRMLQLFEETLVYLSKLSEMRVDTLRRCFLVADTFTETDLIDVSTGKPMFKRAEQVD